ncbi:VCBS repeat-containing protein [Myxococcota bacterium]|nr:VCBS repeat-containing protein [Myxococcota bacterium]
MRKPWMRFGTLVHALAATCLVASCGGGGSPAADVWDLPGGDLAPDSVPDEGDLVPDGADLVPDGEVPPPAPEISFVFVTAIGPKGEDEEVVQLVATDELPDYLATPGFQVAIEATTRQVETGRPVELWIAGNRMASGNVAAGNEGTGIVRFEPVTLTHNPAGYEVRLVATNAAGQAAEAAKTVQVDIGGCGIVLAPTNGTCWLEDADPEAPGTQVRFQVRNPDLTCTDARIEITVGDQTLTAGPNPLDDQGVAVFTLTLAGDGEVPDGLPFLVTAEVSDAASPERTARLDQVPFVADLVDPEITLTEPEKDLLTLADDQDLDPTNGLQWDAAGTATGLPEGGTVQVTLNGEPAGEATPDGLGLWRVAGLSCTADGGYVLVATGRDSCGRMGRAEKRFTARVTQAALVLAWPTAGEALLAKDDRDPATPLVYETGFRVQGTGVETGRSLFLRCREDRFGSPEVGVGSLAVETLSEDGFYEVPVALPVQALTQRVRCRVLDDGTNPSTSGEIAFRVGLPAPRLALVRPRNGDVLKTASLPVALTATGLNGVIPTVSVRDQDGNEALAYTPPRAIASGSLSFTIPLSVGGIPLADGSWRVQVDAQDEFGNRASDHPDSLTSATILLDQTPPEVAITEPDHDDLDPAARPADADVRPEEPGYQIDLGVTVASGGGAGTKVCLTVNQDTSCRVTGDGETQVRFPGVTLLPGANALSATATDPAGNTGGPVSRTLTLSWPGPRVAVVTPPRDGPLAGAPFDVRVRVADRDDLPLEGAVVTLSRDGVDLGQAPSDPQGIALFQVPDLAETPQTFRAQATWGGEEGHSAPRVLFLKTAAPLLAFAMPRNQQWFNLASPECEPGEDNCILTVEVDAPNFEDGSPASLVVTCGTVRKATYLASVSGERLSFPDVVLYNLTPCSLTVTATDVTGQEVTEGPISAFVDRSAPRLPAFEAPDPNLPSLTYIQDEDPSRPGLQYTFVVQVSGLEAGRVVTLDYGPLAGPFDQVTAEVATAVPDGLLGSVHFPQVTLPDGILLIRAEASDVAGNPATLSRTLQVFGTRPVVRMTLPAFVDAASCSTSASCAAGGVCAGGQCAIPWSASGSKAVVVTVADLPAGTQNLRLCARGTGLTGPACSTTGYRQVAIGNSGGSGNTTLVPAGMPDGSFSLVAEGRLADGLPWVSSLDGPNAGERIRYVYLDTVAPSVTSVTSPSDTEEPFGTLNAAEQAAPGRAYRIQVTASEPGTLTLWVNGAAQSTDPDFAGSLVALATLREGGNEVHARVQDLVGNLSPLPPSTPVFRPTVDTIPPTLAFQWPASGTVRAGDSRDIVVVSDAIGRTVTLKDLGLPVATATVDAGGKATFPFAVHPVLTEGDHQIEAGVSDEAGNPAVTTRQVRVDTQAPDALLALPADGAVFGDGDDAKPAIPGFQVEVSYGSPSPDAVSYLLELARNCDGTFTLCDPPERLSQGNLQNPGGLEASLFPTLPAGATPYYRMLLTITDGIGNQQTAVSSFTVNLTACQVVIGGIGSGGYLSNQFCPAPGTDCATAAVTVQVTVSPACGAVDTVRLIQTGQANRDLPLSGQQVDFPSTVQDGTTVQFEARALESGALVGSSGAVVRIVDLRDPQVAFTLPGAGSEVFWGIAADRGPAPGLQALLRVHLQDDHLAGGQLAGLALDASPLAPDSPALPVILGASSEDLELQVSLAHDAAGTVTVTARDAAGNEAASNFTVHVDLVAPAAPTLSVQQVNRRRPAVTLQWTDTGDDGSGGGPATRYDLRYSPLPIQSVADFEAACKVEGLAYTSPLPGPGVPGTPVAFQVTGPDPRSPAYAEHGTPCRFATGTDPNGTQYAFALRVEDEAGNASPPAILGGIDLSLRYARFYGTTTPYSDILMQRRIATVGDLDGDGLGDLVLGGGGGTMQNTVCVIYGFGEGADRAVPDLAISAATGPHHQCLAGGTNFGMPAASAGDLNGDGVRDLAVGEASTTAPVLKVFLGVAGGRLAAAPNLTFTGMQHASGGPTAVAVAGGFDFDGDGIQDLLVGSYGQNRAYLVPGNSAWGPATSATIDLSSATDLGTYRVSIFQMNGAPAGTFFGVRVAAVGDLQRNGHDDIAIGTATAPSQVLVFQGRAVPTPTTFEVNYGTGGADDSRVIRLVPDQETTSGNFGTTIAGMTDLDGDGLPEVMVSQPAASTQTPPKTLVVFRGGYLAGRYGQKVKVDANTGTGTGIFQNERGLEVIGSYDKMVPVGNLDDDPSGPSVDLAYIVYTTGSTRGKVFVRLNHDDPAGAFDTGTFPWESPVLVDPLDPSGTRFGYFGAASPGDFNGDGLPDLLVGTDGSGYAMLLY